MKFESLNILTLVVGLVAAVPTESLSDDIDNYPSIVRLGRYETIRGSSQFMSECMGTLIAPNKVLTTALCADALTTDGKLDTRAVALFGPDAMRCQVPSKADIVPITAAQSHHLLYTENMFFNPAFNLAVLTLSDKTHAGAGRSAKFTPAELPPEGQASNGGDILGTFSYSLIMGSFRPPGAPQPEMSFTHCYATLFHATPALSGQLMGKPGADLREAPLVPTITWPVAGAPMPAGTLQTLRLQGEFSYLFSIDVPNVKHQGSALFESGRPQQLKAVLVSGDMKAVDDHRVPEVMEALEWFHGLTAETRAALRETYFDGQATLSSHRQTLMDCYCYQTKRTASRDGLRCQEQSCEKARHMTKQVQLLSNQQMRDPIFVSLAEPLVQEFIRAQL